MDAWLNTVKDGRIKNEEKSSHRAIFIIRLTLFWNWYSIGFNVEEKIKRIKNDSFNFYELVWKTLDMESEKKRKKIRTILHMAQFFNVIKIVFEIDTLWKIKRKKWKWLNSMLLWMSVRHHKR